MLRYDFVDLSQAIVPADTRNDEAQITRPKPESKPPLDMQVLALRDDLVELLTVTEDAVRAANLDRPRQCRVRDGYAVDQAVRYLSERVDTIAAVESLTYLDERLSGLDVLALLGTTHRRIRRCVGLLAPVVALPGACPKCGVTALRRRDDDEGRVWCQQCRTALTKQQYYAACRMQFAGVTSDQEPRCT